MDKAARKVAGSQGGGAMSDIFANITPLQIGRIEQLLEKREFNAISQAEWDAYRAHKMGEGILEMEADFARIAEALGIEGEYHVSFGIDEILGAIAKLRGDT